MEELHWGVIRELHAPKQLWHECTPAAGRAPRVQSLLWIRQRLGLNLRFSSKCKSRNMAEAPLLPFHQFCEWYLLFYKYEPDTGLRNCWKLNQWFSFEINFSQWVKWKVFSLSDILTICGFPTQCAELNWRAGSIWMSYLFPDNLGFSSVFVWYACNCLVSLKRGICKTKKLHFSLYTWMHIIKVNRESNLNDFSWSLEQSGEEQIWLSLQADWNYFGKILGKFMWAH